MSHRHKFKKEIQYESEFVRELQRKVLHTDPLFLVEVKLLPAKSGGSHNIKLNTNDKKLVNIELNFGTIDRQTIYRIIANEFRSESTVCLLNRYIQKGGNDLRGYLADVCSINSSKVDGPNISDKSTCLKINEHLIDDIGILLPDLEPKKILDIGSSSDSIKELKSAYPNAVINSNSNLSTELPTDKFDLIVLSQYLHHCTDEEITVIIKYLKQHLSDNGCIFIREIDVDDKLKPIADLAHDLHYYLLGNTDQRPVINYIPKERLFELFTEFTVTAESQHNQKYNELSVYSMVFEI
jgi:SAM-dependent methyltransferase